MSLTMPTTSGPDAVWDAFRSPLGRYETERAAQLSGVPRSTLYDWKREDVYRPDWSKASPLAWSYRDLVLVRLLAWLRSHRMPRPIASAAVTEIRHRLAQGEHIGRLRSDGRTVLVDDETQSSVVRENLLSLSFVELLDQFDLLEPVEELGRAALWGPSLLVPSTLSYIAPAVMGGEPCVRRSRIPTASIYALHRVRNLSRANIVKLYPGLDIAAVDDAIGLERRLQRAA